MQIEKIFVVKMGEVSLLTADGQAVTDPAFVREAGGFTFFGDACLEAIAKCPYTVRVPHRLSNPCSCSNASATKSYVTNSALRLTSDTCYRLLRSYVSLPLV